MLTVLLKVRPAKAEGSDWAIVTVDELVIQVMQWLQLAGIDSARLDAEVIMGHVLGRSREWLLAHDDALVSSVDGQRVEELVQRRAKREPLAYIVGYKEFYGRRFIVAPDVLIPRPESEVIIDELSSVLKPLFGKKGRAIDLVDAGDIVQTAHATNNLSASQSLGTSTYQREADAPPVSSSLDREGQKNSIKLLDLGTGSGCLGITAKLEYPTLDVTLADISDKALAVARENAVQLCADVKLVKSDLLNSIDGKFDIILANLPYVNPDWDYLSPELRYEPDLALYADNDGLALIYKLIDQAPAHLARDGYLILEMDTPQIERVVRYAAEAGFSTIQKLPFTLVLKFSLHRA